MMKGSLSSSAVMLHEHPRRSLHSYSVPRLLPWLDWKEWYHVYCLLYHHDPPQRWEGVQYVAMWRARERVPHAADVSAQLVELRLTDDLGGMGWEVAGPQRSDMELRLAYSAVIVRGVNGLVEPGQKGTHAMSIMHLAHALCLPNWVVDMRHQSTHKDLPSLPALRLAGSFLLDYLQQRYWMAQQDHLDFLRIAFSRLLGKYTKVAEGSVSGRITTNKRNKEQSDQPTHHHYHLHGPQAGFLSTESEGAGDIQRQGSRTKLSIFLERPYKKKKDGRNGCCNGFSSSESQQQLPPSAMSAVSYSSSSLSVEQVAAKSMTLTSAAAGNYSVYDDKDDDDDDDHGDVGGVRLPNKPFLSSSLSATAICSNDEISQQRHSNDGNIKESSKRGGSISSNPGGGGSGGSSGGGVAYGAGDGEAGRCANDLIEHATPTALATLLIPLLVHSPPPPPTSAVSTTSSPSFASLSAAAASSPSSLAISMPGLLTPPSFLVNSNFNFNFNNHASSSASPPRSSTNIASIAAFPSFAINNIDAKGGFHYHHETGWDSNDHAASSLPCSSGAHGREAFEALVAMYLPLLRRCNLAWRGFSAALLIQLVDMFIAEEGERKDVWDNEDEVQQMDDGDDDVDVVGVEEEYDYEREAEEGRKDEERQEEAKQHSRRSGSSSDSQFHDGADGCGSSGGGDGGGDGGGGGGGGGVGMSSTSIVDKGDIERPRGGRMQAVNNFGGGGYHAGASKWGFSKEEEEEEEQQQQRRQQGHHCPGSHHQQHQQQQQRSQLQQPSLPSQRRKRRLQPQQRQCQQPVLSLRWTLCLGWVALLLSDEWLSLNSVAYSLPNRAKQELEERQKNSRHKQRTIEKEREEPRNRESERECGIESVGVGVGNIKPMGNGKAQMAFRYAIDDERPDFNEASRQNSGRKGNESSKSAAGVDIEERSWWLNYQPAPRLCHTRYTRMPVDELHRKCLQYLSSRRQKRRASAMHNDGGDNEGGESEGCRTARGFGRRKVRVHASMRGNGKRHYSSSSDDVHDCGGGGAGGGAGSGGGGGSRVSRQQRRFGAAGTFKSSAGLRVRDKMEELEIILKRSCQEKKSEHESERQRHESGGRDRSEGGYQSQRDQLTTIPHAEEGRARKRGKRVSCIMTAEPLRVQQHRGQEKRLPSAKLLSLEDMERLLGCSTEKPFTVRRKQQQTMTTTTTTTGDVQRTFSNSSGEKIALCSESGCGAAENDLYGDDGNDGLWSSEKLLTGGMSCSKSSSNMVSESSSSTSPMDDEAMAVTSAASLSSSPSSLQSRKDAETLPLLALMSSSLPMPLMSESNRKGGGGGGGSGAGGEGSREEARARLLEGAGRSAKEGSVRLGVAKGKRRPSNVVENRQLSDVSDGGDGGSDHIISVVVTAATAGGGGASDGEVDSKRGTGNGNGTGPDGGGGGGRHDGCSVNDDRSGDGISATAAAIGGAGGSQSGTGNLAGAWSVCEDWTPCPIGALPGWSTWMADVYVADV